MKTTCTLYCQQTQRFFHSCPDNLTFHRYSIPKLIYPFPIPLFPPPVTLPFPPRLTLPLPTTLNPSHYPKHFPHYP